MSNEALDLGTAFLSAGYLRRVRTKSFRNHNWWRLSPVERAFYKSAMHLAELRNYVANRQLVEALRDLMTVLLETPSAKVMKLGIERAERMLLNLSRKGLTIWTSSLLGNIANADFIFCLGLGCINMIHAGVDLT